MKACRTAVCFYLLLVASDFRNVFAATPQVEVIAKTAKVKVNQETIAVVEKGQTYRLLKTQGAWAAILIGEGEKAKRGWVLASAVKLLPDSEITEESEAPAEPLDVRVSIDMTQVSGWGPQSVVYFKIQIGNESSEPIDFKIADLDLKVDDRSLTRPDLANGFGFPVFTDGSMRGQVQAQSLPFLKDAKLETGSTIEGWLGFNVPNLQQAPGNPNAIIGRSWIVEGKVGPNPIRIDLKAHETDLIAEKSRPSKLDPTVQVIEVGPRINALNASKVMDLLRAVPPGDKGCVMVLKNKQCLFDNLATQQFQQQMFQLMNSGNQPVVSYEGGLPVNQQYGYQGLFFNGQIQSVTSETAGVLTVLGRRPQTGAVLLKHLGDDQSETRAAAAQALTGHLAEANVIQALAKATEDAEIAVRIAAIGALGGGAIPQAGMAVPAGFPQPARGRAARIPAAVVRRNVQGGPGLEVVQPAANLPQPGMRQNGSVDTLAIIKGMSDREAGVRLAAAQTAAVFPCDEVRAALIKLLDDPDLSVQLASTGSIGTVEARDGIPKLKILQTDANPQMKTTAIDALIKLGELSALEGAVAKLDGGTLQDADFTALGQAREKRAVEPLIRQLKVENNYQINLVARTLGEIGDSRAVEPLIQTFVFGNRNYQMDELPRALGKLGDRRAIDPLRQAMQAPNLQIQPQLRAAMLESLFLLKAPKVLDDVTQEMQKMAAANRHFEISPLLQALGRSRDPKAVTIIEPYLENQQTSRAAAQALVQLGTRPAYAALESKLTGANFPVAQMIILNQQWPRTAAAVAFLRKISESQDENVRRAATQALNNLQAFIPATGGAVAPMPIGYISPSFEAENAVEEWVNGKAMTATDLHGKVQVIYLPDTAGSAPALPKEGNEYLEKFENQGLVVLALWKMAGWEWDAAGFGLVIKPEGTSSQEQQAVAALAEFREIKYRIGLVSAVSGLTEKYGGPSAARVALVDRAGVLQAVRSLDEIDSGLSDFESLIQELLAESPPTASFVRLPRQILPPPDVPKLPRSAVLAYAASGFDSAGDSRTIPAHHDTIWSVKFAPDGNSIASTSTDGTARIWDLTTGKLRHTLNGHDGNIRHCTFNHDGSKLFTAGFDRTIRIWDTATGALEKSLTDDAPVYFLSLIEDDQTLISASQDSRVRHWNITEGKIKGYFAGHSSSAWTTAARTIAGNRSIVVSGSPDQTVRIWEFPSGEARHTLSGHHSGVNAVAISDDGQWIASGGDEVILWDAASGTEKHRFSLPGTFAYDLAFSPDQRLIAVSRNNHTVSLYEVATGALVRQWNRGGYCVHFSNDGKRLASGSDDRTIRIWNVTNSNHLTAK